MRVAFLGLGRMGAAMAAHVVRAGHETTVWNRSPGRAAELVALGAREASDVADAVVGAEVVVTMLADPAAVREVLDEVASAAPRGALVVDCSTVGAETTREVGQHLAGAGLALVDAPVVGSLAPARDGTLVVLAGGSADDVERARPLLGTWGDPEKVRHVGPLGAGSAMKLVVNATLGVVAEGVAEALRLGGDLGLDRAVTLDVLQAGLLGAVVAQKRAMLDSGDFSDTAFGLDLMVKDLDLCLDAARRPLPAVHAAREHAALAARAGHGADDYAAFIGWAQDHDD